LTPVATFFLAITMFVAIAKFHLPHGDPFVSPNPGGESWELAAGYLGAVLAVQLLGPGRLSLDYLIFGRAQGAAPATAAPTSATGVRP